MDQVTDRKRKSKETNGSGLKRKEYEQKLRKLHVELVKLQEWVKHEARRFALSSREEMAPAKVVSSRP